MDPRKRFSSRVDNYIKYRPGYPSEILTTLQKECGLISSAVIADVGSGTGLLSKLFLDFGCQVIGVEPNAEMRAAGERLLAGYPNFASQDGSAEATGLRDGSVDFVTAGQAFHWFNPPRAHTEFKRILRPAGIVGLVWNERRLESTPFLKAYEALLQTFATDYNEIKHRNIKADPQAIPGFFAGDYRVVTFGNVQVFDFDGVKGRLESSSYVPEAGQPTYEPMLVELRRIFDQFQCNGRVAFEYDTCLYYGRI